MPAMRPATQPAMTKAKNDEITANASAAKPTPLHEVMRPSTPALCAPIAVPMSPKSTTATTAAIAPMITAVQLMGQAIHVVPTAGRTPTVRCPITRHPRSVRSGSTGAEAMPRLRAHLGRACAASLREPWESRDHVVEVVMNDEAEKCRAHEERKEPEQERDAPDVPAVLADIAHARLLAAQEARDLQVVRVELLLFGLRADRRRDGGHGVGLCHRRGRAGRDLPLVDRLVDAPQRARLVEARRDDADLHVVLHALVDDRAEDDVRLGVCGRVDDLRGLVHLEEREVRPAGDREEHAAR